MGTEVVKIQAVGLVLLLGLIQEEKRSAGSLAVGTCAVMFTAKP